MIVIIDYGAGNLFSIAQAIRDKGYEVEITDDPNKIRSAKRIILPGVGSFGYLMQKIEEKGIDVAIKDAIKKGASYFGICVGLQVLFEGSEESPGVAGLGILKGEVKKFTKGKVPQIGWNKTTSTKENKFLDSDYFYFVNSYYASPNDSDVVVAKTNYYIEFASVINKDNIFATQFHPEKSGVAGLELLNRWLSC